MKKLCSLLLVLLLCVSLFTGCAEKEDPVHPPKYSMLAPLMHRPLEEFYKETGLTEGDLVKRGTSYYELPDTVTFCDLPFTVTLSTDDVNGYFCKFQYVHDLTGSDEEKIATIQSLAKHFTDALGRSQHSYAYGSVRVSERIAEMDVEELSKKLFGKRTLTVNDHWILGAPDEEKTKDYKAILVSLGKYHIPNAAAKPVIVFEMAIYSDPDLSKQTIILNYEITYWWETVDDAFIDSLPGR